MSLWHCFCIMGPSEILACQLQAIRAQGQSLATPRSAAETTQVLRPILAISWYRPALQPGNVNTLVIADIPTTLQPGHVQRLLIPVPGRLRPTPRFAAGTAPGSLPTLPGQWYQLAPRPENANTPAIADILTTLQPGHARRLLILVPELIRPTPRCVPETTPD